MLPLKMSFIKKIMKNMSYTDTDVEGLDYCCTQGNYFFHSISEFNEFDDVEDYFSLDE